MPAEYHRQIFSGIIDHSLAVRFLSGVGTDILVKYDCSQCTTPTLIKWNKLGARKHQPYLDICNKCLQTAINIDPAALERNRKCSSMLWHDEKYRLACLKSFSEHNHRMQTDVEYARLHQRKCNSVTGSILIGGHSIQFDSGYELLFISAVHKQCSMFRRCEFAIAYGGHFYHPDFFLVYPDGKRVVAEVKGYYQTNVLEKQAAAAAYIAATDLADEYVLYDVDRLIADGIFVGGGGARMWQQIRSISNGIVTFSDPKHKRIAEIGYSRYRKEVKNQVVEKTPV